MASWLTLLHKHVHTADGSTYLHEIKSRSRSWKCDSIKLKIWLWQTPTSVPYVKRHFLKSDYWNIIIQCRFSNATYLVHDTSKYMTVAFVIIWQLRQHYPVIKYWNKFPKYLVKCITRIRMARVKKYETTLCLRKKCTNFETHLKIIRLYSDDIWQKYSKYRRIEYACISFCALLATFRLWNRTPKITQILKITHHTA